MNYFLLLSGDAFTCITFPSVADYLALFFAWPSIMAFVRALSLLRAATFSDLRTRRNGTHELKAV